MQVKTIVPTVYKVGVCFIGAAFIFYFFVVGGQQKETTLWMRTDLVFISGVLLFPLLLVSAQLFDPFRIFRSILVGSLIILAMFGFAVLNYQNYNEIYDTTKGVVFPRVYSSIVGGPISMQTLNDKDAEIIAEMIQIETRATLDGDLLALESLYDSGADVVNRKHTLLNKADDLIYNGWDDIRQEYYVPLFKTASIDMPFEISNLKIFIQDKKAIVTDNGIVINGRYFPDFVIYTFRKLETGWRITCLEIGN